MCLKTAKWLEMVFGHQATFVLRPQCFTARGIFSRAAKFVVLLRKCAELRNSRFSAEIVEFLENQTNVFNTVHCQQLA